MPAYSLLSMLINGINEYSFIYGMMLYKTEKKTIQ